jgi:hypothetical protein
MGSLVTRRDEKRRRQEGLRSDTLPVPIAAWFAYQQITA